MIVIFFTVHFPRKPEMLVIKVASIRSLDRSLVQVESDEKFKRDLVTPY